MYGSECTWMCTYVCISLHVYMYVLSTQPQNTVSRSCNYKLFCCLLCGCLFMTVSFRNFPRHFPHVMLSNGQIKLPVPTAAAAVACLPVPASVLWQSLFSLWFAALIKYHVRNAPQENLLILGFFYCCCCWSCINIWCMCKWARTQASNSSSSNITILYTEKSS